MKIGSYTVNSFSFQDAEGNTLGKFVYDDDDECYYFNPDDGWLFCAEELTKIAAALKIADRDIKRKGRR